MTPTGHRDEFNAELEHCRALRQYAVDHISDADVKSLTFESALSRSFRAYENFVEGVFLAFMSGEYTASGVAPARYVSPPSRDHARRMLQGHARFLDWADPSIVISRGEYFLDVEGPLSTAVTQAWNTIDWMRRIRNHIAHNSLESMGQYRKVVTTILLVEPTALPHPGDLLQARPQRGPFKGREVLSGLFSDLDSFVTSAIG
ncbi:hypothetical protein [Microbacterium oxydans]|uniref:hypothetical protein n=1 Tax=Microbacterium oxydans TaxID=82380 RepID=UPI00366C54F3